MSYVALYRKFRPRTFGDVKGQDHIVRTLRNQIMSDRIGHAFLFTGTRGTGKTSVAKILASAVNCEHPVDGSPCGECPSCQAIKSGISMNVVELDAASNNGVDSIRDIIEQTEYAPTEGKYKVFIIDEVHMLSTSAFNALLKTLEEPPSYVIFVLATTEVNKLPITVLSRCQEYDFHRISIETIRDRMKELIDAEGAKVTDDALLYIAKAADGSMRDGLSILDQCIAFYLDREEVTLDNVLDVLGAADQTVFERLLTCLEERNVSGALDELNQAVMQGRDLRQFIADFIWFLRNMLIIKSGDHLENMLDLSQNTINEIRAMAENIPTAKLIRYIKVLSDLSNRIRYSGQRRVEVEVALIKLCRPQMEQNVEALIDRINQLEETLYSGRPVSAIEAAGPEALEAAIKAAPRPAVKRAEMPKAVPEDIQDVVKNFRSIVSDIGSGLDRMYLSDARLNLKGDTLQVVFTDQLGYAFYQEEERQNKLLDGISERTGKNVPVEFAYNDTGRPYEESYVDLEKLIHMDITVEDDEEF